MGKSDRVAAKAWAFEQAIKRRIARDPGWRVLVGGRQWLCPYCGQVGIAHYRESHGPHDILHHFVEECPEWAEDKGTRFNHIDLQNKARRLEIEGALRSDPAWRVADGQGCWHCPFCTQPTPVGWPLPDDDASLPVEQVEQHLKTCQPHLDKRKPHTVEALGLIVEDATRHAELTAEIRRNIEQDPAWRQAAPDGAWICPHCRQPVPDVDISSDLLLASVAPARMARHVMERCGKGGKTAPASGGERAAKPEADTSQRNLERAREIVQKMLPAEVPAIEGYDLHCLYRPTESVGGDFYDYFRLSDHEVAVLIGDVSGHGLEAALIMTMVKKSLKLHAQHHRSPAEVLRRTNLDINADLDARTFVSVCYAVLDAHRGTLTFARAGHNMPILFNPRRRPPVRHLESKGMALGMYQGGLFDKMIQESEIRLSPGDVFVLYTDGLTEARNADNECYGLARLEAALARSHGDLSSHALADRLVEDVRRFGQGVAMDDDVAVLCLACSGA